MTQHCCPQCTSIMQLVICVMTQCCCPQCTSIMQLVICVMTQRCCPQCTSFIQLYVSWHNAAVHSALVLYSYMCHDTMLLSTQHAGIMQLVIYSSGSMEVLLGPQYGAVCFLNGSSGMQISLRTLLWMLLRRWRSQMARVVFYTRWKQWTFWRLMDVVPGRVCL